LEVKNVFNKNRTFASKTPDDQLSHSNAKRFGKKPYVIVIAMIAIAVIAGAFLVPQGAASIQLSVNYTVGEKMDYTTVMTGTFESYNSTGSSQALSPKNFTSSASDTIEVVDFDGEYYTLNHTMALNDIQPSFSMLEKMSKTGYSSYVFNLGNTTQEAPNNGVTSSSFLAQLLTKPEVKVGDTITVPYPSISGIATTGDLKITFKGYEDISTPAGTFRVFKVGMTSENVSMHLDTNNPEVNMASNLDMSYTVYLESGTMRLIKSTMEETVSTQSTFHSTALSYTMHLAMDMTLKQDIKP
jgi:hypothetical protein